MSVRTKDPTTLPFARCMDKGSMALMTVRRATPHDIDALLGLVEGFYHLDGHTF